MPNTNPQCVKWANERTRVLANKVDDLDDAINDYITDWTSQGLSALITAAGAAELIADGSDVDGRPRMSGTQMTNFRAALLQLQASYAASVSGVGASVTAIVSPIKTRIVE